MQKVFLLLLCLIVGCPADMAISAVINGELVRAGFERSSAAPTPAWPGRVYYDTDDLKAYMYSNGAWGGLGGGGAGEISAISGADSAVGWASTGAGVTVATTTTTTDLPLGDGAAVSTAIKITPVSGTTDYAYFCWTQPEALKNRKLALKWEQRPLSGYASGDLKLDLYSFASASCGSTATRVTLPDTDVSSVTSIPNTSGQFYTTFDAGTESYYGIRIGRVAGTTALNIARVIVGPGTRSSGLAGGYIGTFATATTHTTNIQAQGGTYWRDNDRLIFKGQIEFSGVNTEGTLQPALPSSSYTVDTSKLFNGFTDTTTDLVDVGGWSSRDDSTGTVYSGRVLWDNSSAAMRLGYQDTNGVVRTDLNIPYTIADNDTFTWTVEVPITQWSGGAVNIGENNVEYAFNTDVSNAADTTSFGYGPSGTPFPGSTFTAARNKTVRFQSAISATDVISMEIQPIVGATDGWTPLVNDGVIGPTAIQPLDLQNGTYYGAGIHSVINATDVIVRIGQYSYASGTTYASAGSNWDATSDNFRWRLKKVSGGAAVGFAQANSVSRGLVYGKQYLFDQTYEGLTDATFADLTGTTTTLTITPGTYLVTVAARPSVTYSVIPTSVNSQITAADPSNVSVCTLLATTAANTGTLWRGDSSMQCLVTVSSTTVYHMRGYIDVTGGTVGASDRDIATANMVWERVQ